MLHARHFIAGEWLDEDRFRSEKVLNPANGEVIGRQSLGTVDLTERAIVVAKETFETTAWSRSPRQRSLALFRLADLVEAHKDELIDLIVLENGKLRMDAGFEINTSINELRYYA